MKKIIFTSLFLNHLLNPLLADEVTPQLLEAKSANSIKVIDYGYNKFQKSPYSDEIVAIPFDHSESIERFQLSQHKKSFFKLAPHYSPQQVITNCGIASAIIVLNAIYAEQKKQPPIFLKGSHYDKEKNTVYGQYLWTETNFYTPQVVEKIDKEVVEGKKLVNKCYLLGLTLDQLATTLNLQGVKATAYPVKEKSKENIEKFRTVVKSITANPTQFMIAHYKLSVYMNDEGGHFSPIAAYDEKSDSILILDTWSAANTWIWVKLEDLYQSMNTLDGNNYRG